MKLPSHIPIHINRTNIEEFKQILINLGYRHTFLQITKPGQIFGVVKELEYRGIIVEHHVRSFYDGMITAEVELPRIKEVWLHLTSHSISAHEQIIEILEQNNIEFRIDETLRNQFKIQEPHDFRRDILELFRWFFIGVCYWIPLSYLWKFNQKMKSVFKNEEKKENNSKENELEGKKHYKNVIAD